MSSEDSDIAELPSSPPLLPANHSLSCRKKRSRSRSIFDHHTSSDPPLFSSDPPDEGIENYNGHRKKRKHRGTWWNHSSSRDYVVEDSAGEQSYKRKQNFARNFDSGVFMGSDRTEDSLDLTLDDSHTYTGSEAPRPTFAFQNQAVAHDNAGKHMKRYGPDSQRTLSTDPDTSAGLVVLQCVEDGKERVDLSNMHLSSLSDSTLRPLHSLIKLPPAHDTAPDPTAYTPLTPKLQLFLYNNQLQSLPTELWNLENLTVLSLRGNNLKVLPAGIGNLRNLEELNLAGNQLRYLPGELLDLLAPKGRLTRLTALPNPFYEYIPWTPAMRQALKARSDFSVFGYQKDLSVGEKPMGFTASSAVARFKFDGTWDPQSAIPPSATLDEGPQPSRSPASHRRTPVPSLFELCLRACSHYTRSQLLPLLPHDLPPSITHALDTITSIQRDEARHCRRCAVCGKDYVLPRAEWIEYWHADASEAINDDHFYPFLKRGCSETCVPVAALPASEPSEQF